MICIRCQGLMVAETICNPREGSVHAWVAVARCVNCGNLEDDLIRRARDLPTCSQQPARPGPQRRGVWMRPPQDLMAAGQAAAATIR